MDETTTDDVRTEFEIADDAEILLREEDLEVERKSKVPRIAFTFLAEGDVVRVNDDLHLVTDAGEAVHALDGGEVALAESTDGSISLVGVGGVQDVETLYVAAVVVDEDEAAEETVDVDAHPFDDEGEGDARGTVEVDAVEDDRLVLTGDTYDAKEDIKRVDYQAWDFDGDRKVWVVDVDALQDLHDYLNAAGFRLVDDRDDAEADEDDGQDGLQQFREVVDRVDEGDRVRVDYQQKNRQGYNSKGGVVLKSRRATEEWEEEPHFTFERDDGQTMRLGLLEDGTLALFTQMSHAPLVGFVEGVDVVDEEETADGVAA